MPYPNESRTLYSDTQQKLVLTNVAQAAGPLAAEANAACQTASCSLTGVKQLGIVANITNRNAATLLNIKVRFSGKPNPDVTVVTDWGFIMVDNIDTSTGISTVQEYVIQIDLANVNGVANPTTARQYVCRVEQISALNASAIVFADSACDGEIYFVNLGG